MKQGLEIIVGRPRVAHYESRLKIGGAESDGVCESELIRPVGIADHAI